MKEASDYRAAEFGPMKNKTFAGALSAFFEKECPHLGGERIRKVLVQAIVDIVDRFYPRTTHLRPGQTPWITVDRNESSAYGKKMTETKMTSVILDLVTPQDADDRIKGKRTRQTRKEALGRLCKQAYEQGGCLTTAELCILLKAPKTEVTQLIRQWQEENEEVLPTRGTIHDIGPSVTHKKKIIEKLFLYFQNCGIFFPQITHGQNYPPSLPLGRDSLLSLSGLSSSSSLPGSTTFSSTQSVDRACPLDPVLTEMAQKANDQRWMILLRDSGQSREWSESFPRYSSKFHC